VYKHIAAAVVDDAMVAHPMPTTKDKEKD